MVSAVNRPVSPSGALRAGAGEFCSMSQLLRRGNASMSGVCSNTSLALCQESTGAQAAVHHIEAWSPVRSTPDLGCGLGCMLQNKLGPPSGVHRNCRSLSASPFSLLLSLHFTWDCVWLCSTPHRLSVLSLKLVKGQLWAHPAPVGT